MNILTKDYRLVLERAILLSRYVKNFDLHGVKLSYFFYLI